MIETKTEIVCHACSSVNRVPAQRMVDYPLCGKCKTPLFPGHPVELSDANFDKFVSRTGVPVVVDFWAPHCGPCLRMAPAFAAAARQLAPQVLLAKLNTSESPATAARFNITGIPCLIVFAGGRESRRQMGMMNTEQIVGWIRSR
jgi:thioredoxin 2